MDLATARTLLAQAQRVAVLTGAGISAESDIPTFRDAITGHWARFRPEDLASPEAYARDPELVWEWYLGRYRDVLQAQPNAGHRQLARLERQKGKGFFLATQNVDRLHSRAGSGSHGGTLVELHGNLVTARCPRCEQVVPLKPPQEGQKPPRCPQCQEMMRPNIVWFGEFLPVDALEAAQVAFYTAQVALIVGTSGVVYPAAGLAQLTRRAGGSVIEINPIETELSDQMDLVVRASASQGLAQLLEQA